MTKITLRKSNSTNKPTLIVANEGLQTYVSLVRIALAALTAYKDFDLAVNDDLTTITGTKDGITTDLINITIE